MSDAIIDRIAEKHSSTSATSEISYTNNERKLKLFESPLAHQRKTSTLSNSPSQPTFVNISGPVELAAPYSLSHNNDNASNNGVHISHNERLDEVQMRETPEFKRYEEATNLELFYDLFFVANLTTFTNSHEINQVSSLKAYAGFFCILWFLWLQVGLFDVRFGQDSILERIGKACQFGVMIRIAMIGADFEPDKQDHHVFQSLALVLAISRLVLAFQYSIVLREIWNYKNSRLPLSLIVGANCMATLIYFGTSFAFKPENSRSRVFIIWYIVATLETIINIAISTKWKVLTFDGTHLIKRMSLLTLIILGEGVIAISKSIAAISKSGDDVDTPLLATIFSAVIIVYLVYMLYFDRINYDHFGTRREGYWTFIHFPFHLALVLLMEGVAQFILWRKVSEVLKITNKTIRTAQQAFNGTTSASIASLYTSLVEPVFLDFSLELRTQSLEMGRQIITNIENTQFESEEQTSLSNALFALVQESIFENFGIDPPELEESTIFDATEQISSHRKAFMLIFVYFLVSSGLTIALLNILTFTSSTTRSRAQILRTISTVAIGLAISGLAAVVNSEIGLRFAMSAWLLPTVGFTFGAVLASMYTDLWWP